MVSLVDLLLSRGELRKKPGAFGFRSSGAFGLSSGLAGGGIKGWTYNSLRKNKNYVPIKTCYFLSIGKMRIDY